MIYLHVVVNLYDWLSSKETIWIMFTLYFFLNVVTKRYTVMWIYIKKLYKLVIWCTLMVSFCSMQEITSHNNTEIITEFWLIFSCGCCNLSVLFFFLSQNIWQWSIFPFVNVYEQHKQKPCTLFSLHYTCCYHDSISFQSLMDFCPDFFRFQTGNLHSDKKNIYGPLQNWCKLLSHN